MDFRELAVAMQKTANTLIDGWLAKTVITGAIVTIGVQGTALGAFLVLIVLDLVARWAALSHQHLVDACKTEESGSLYCCMVNIPAAFKAGYINSSAMKHRFAGKMIWYCLLTIMAGSADQVLKAAGNPPILLGATWGYLAATEVMSILEKLRDAGVEQAGDLLEFIRGRLGSFIKK